MSFARLSLSLAAVIGLIATALAGATIWLLITQPVDRRRRRRDGRSLSAHARARRRPLRRPRRHRQIPVTAIQRNLTPRVRRVSR